ncbi:MAG: hypothetical protein M1828_004206 [Chrysothrix sp. TS-e1954]|nr:MAG: hypothetical protein M1828_004206 [Chrysothrix sp. TS-e1954]
MRGKVLFFLLVNIAVVSFLLHTVWTLLSLLVVSGSDDAITYSELPSPESEAVGDLPALVPKLIHQTYKNATIPEVWQQAQQSCIDLHKDYEYKLWTDDMAEEFIAKEYSWFLDTFKSYPYPIMRADAIRYFVLAHFGGVYIDLDDGCKRRLDPLLAYPAWVRRTKPTGISNDVMGAVPGHPFFLRVIKSLSHYNRNWFSPYITIMSSTGPLFLSLMWRHYNNDNPEGDDRIRILFPDAYMGSSWSFFTHHLGNSWHKWDTDAILWMSAHWIELTVLGFLIAGVVFTIMWFAYRRVFTSNSTRSSQLFRRIPWLRRVGRRKDYIELSTVEPHEV